MPHILNRLLCSCGFTENSRVMFPGRLLRNNFFSPMSAKPLKLDLLVPWEMIGSAAWKLSTSLQRRISSLNDCLYYKQITLEVLGLGTQGLRLFSLSLSFLWLFWAMLVIEPRITSWRTAVQPRVILTSFSSKQTTGTIWSDLSCANYWYSHAYACQRPLGPGADDQNQFSYRLVLEMSIRAAAEYLQDFFLALPFLHFQRIFFKPQHSLPYSL